MCEGLLVQSLPEWTLVGEYCGVWETQDASAAADDNNDPDTEDPFGLGPLLFDKVSDLGYSCQSAPEAASEGKDLPTPTRLLLAQKPSTSCWRDGLTLH